MNIVTRSFCPDCNVEHRGLTKGGLPVQFIGETGRFPHADVCTGGGDIWVQVYAGETEEEAPPLGLL
ncbi:hypothetical protein LCGC14_2786150 [marine sediment metagenome]|uniref:Uncharacterized protein n=1 Tax=marine sediment metagenome TaxID=412755 RepID=A0A0F8ZDY3_9ZZZZ